MTTIADLDSGQVLGIVDGLDSWRLAARPSADCRLGMKVVAIEPSAGFRKARRMWLPRTAVLVDAFHLVKFGNDMLTEVRQRLSQQVHGGRGRSIDPVWANRWLLRRAGDTLPERARDRLRTVFSTDDAITKSRPPGDDRDPTELLPGWTSNRQPPGSLEVQETTPYTAADRFPGRRCGEAAGLAKTNWLYRTADGDEIEVLIITGATTGKVEANTPP